MMIACMHFPTFRIACNLDKVACSEFIDFCCARQGHLWCLECDECNHEGVDSGVKILQ